MTDRPVLFASYAGVLGGAERMLLDCARRLQRPTVIACPDGPLADAIEQARLRHAALKARPLRTRPQHLFGLTYELTRRERELQPAVIVAWGARTILAAAMMTKRGRPPLLAVHHDLYPKPAIRGAVRAATRRADATAATSHAIAAQLPGGVVVIHPGVDLDAFTPTPAPPGPPQALVIGALVAWKRPDIALRIADKLPDLHVTFAGEPLPGESFDATPRENVTFAGRVPDIRDALAKTHVVLHCADQEPFGLALIEALAAGRPVVAPDAAGPKEIITGPEGRLYPPGDADAAAAALRAVLADRHAPAAARTRAEAFDVNDTVRRLEHAIDSARP
jgi:glycosyltransferase involved in cell wall biosynthesis